MAVHDHETGKNRTQVMLRHSLVLYQIIKQSKTKQDKNLDGVSAKPNPDSLFVNQIVIIILVGHLEGFISFRP